MNGARRIFLPVFGIAVILTLIAVSTWLSDGMKSSDGLVLAGAIVLVWIAVAIVWRKRRP